MENSETKQSAIAFEQEKILKVHETFWQAYAQRDLEKRFSVCSEDVTFFGTGIHERAVGKKQAREMSEKGFVQSPLPFEIQTIWRTIRVFEDIGWVECVTSWIRDNHGNKVKDFIRLTTIFRKENKNWRVVHVHGSEPDYRLKEGEYMVNEKILDRNSELERQVFDRTRELEAEKLKSDTLLLNILPAAVADELKSTGQAIAKLYSHVTRTIQSAFL